MNVYKNRKKESLWPNANKHQTRSKEQSELLRLAGSKQGKGIYFSILSSSLGSSPFTCSLSHSRSNKGAAEGFPGNRVVKKSLANAGKIGDAGLIPGSGSSLK